MRGDDEMQEALFTMAKLEDFVPADHPLRPIRQLVNTALAGLNDLFKQMYPGTGRASIAPEKLMRALLLQVFYSIRSERQLMEQIRYNLLFRWFVGLAIDDPVWDHSVFSKNRDRLIEHEAVDKFFTEVMSLADQKELLSKEHFSVDGTLIQAWASHKSFRPKDGSDDGPGTPGRNAGADWKGRPRSNETHASTTDPDSRLFRKGHGQPALMCYQGHALMENRSGLVVGAVVTHADGYGERQAAVQMMNTIPGRCRKTLGADKNYDTAGFIEACRQSNVTPHIAMNLGRPGGKSAIDGRTARHAAYQASQRIRKRIEEHFGWAKTIGRLRQTVFRGIRRVDQHFKLTMLASNIVRISRIPGAVPEFAMGVSQ
jgi:transposase